MRRAMSHLAMRLSLTIALVVFVTVLQAEVLKPPLGLDLHIPVPEANPLTREKILLGRRLFFDKKLSRDGSLSCASCHEPKHAFSDGRAVARGIHGAEGLRNTPALINRGYGSHFFLDGRASSLESQALEPILNPIELGLTQPELQQRTGLKATEVVAALATYVRTIRSGGSRFDRYSAGESRAVNQLEKEGMRIFRGKGRCNACHVGPNFTDEQFHNTGVAWRDGRFDDEGRFSVTRNPLDHGAFKTPTLREIARTAPYMHDGSIATLEQVINFYSDGGRQNPSLDAQIRPRNLTSEEQLALTAFLRTLTGRIQEGMR
jgi:cytochrome c peroxidase